MGLQEAMRKQVKLLIMCPGRVPRNTDDIRCFTDVINYYLPAELSNVANVTVVDIPSSDNDNLQSIFRNICVDQYDAIVTLGLRFYSTISRETTTLLRDRFGGLLCQVYDGSRYDYDPVDITFTFKDDSKRLSDNPSWYARHIKNNEYIGWAADPELNQPRQSATDLRILVDHTNYGANETDLTAEVLQQVRRLVESDLWQSSYKSVSVRRFDSGEVVDVDFSDLSYTKYDRSKTMPLADISREHSAAHIFCVTHPESVGLVTLETATAGALVVTPKNFIPADRLCTIRHCEWEDSIDWPAVLSSIDIQESRTVATKNNWATVAQNLVTALEKRLTND
jgi:hypothetical protein